MEKLFTLWPNSPIIEPYQCVARIGTGNSGIGCTNPYWSMSKCFGQIRMSFGFPTLDGGSVEPLNVTLESVSASCVNKDFCDHVWYPPRWTTFDSDFKYGTYRDTTYVHKRTNGPIIFVGQQNVGVEYHPVWALRIFFVTPNILGGQDVSPRPERRWVTQMLTPTPGKRESRSQRSRRLYSPFSKPDTHGSRKWVPRILDFCYSKIRETVVSVFVSVNLQR